MLQNTTYIYTGTPFPSLFFSFRAASEGLDSFSMMMKWLVAVDVSHNYYLRCVPITRPTPVFHSGAAEQVQDRHESVHEKQRGSGSCTLYLIIFIFILEFYSSSARAQWKDISWHYKQLPSYILIFIFVFVFYFLSYWLVLSSYWSFLLVTIVIIVHYLSKEENENHEWKP